VSPALKKEHKQVLDIKLISLFLDANTSKILIKLVEEELPKKSGTWGTHITQVYKQEQLFQLLALEDLG